jgi:hypothetical protein
MAICGRKNGCTGPYKTIKKPVNRRNQHYYHVEYINPGKTTKLNKLRDIHCCDMPLNVEDVSPLHPVLGLPGVTTPQDVNLNTVMISPELYNQKGDISMIDMTETQEEDSNKDEPSDDDLALPVAAFTDPISWFADVDDAMMDATGELMRWVGSSRAGMESGCVKMMTWS